MTKCQYDKGIFLNQELLHFTNKMLNYENTKMLRNPLKLVPNSPSLEKIY